LSARLPPGFFVAGFLLLAKTPPRNQKLVQPLFPGRSSKMSTAELRAVFDLFAGFGDR
jgi:hypothetical protein